MTNIPYRGRFAPSPSGPLHFGSLIAALGSYLDAKAHGGQWLLRIEDIDTPRCQDGADTDIMRTLEAFGLTWDESVTYQSHYLDEYQSTLSTLAEKELVYGCDCTRKKLKSAGGICQCQAKSLCLTSNAVRLKANCHTYFEDRLLGRCNVPETFAKEDYIIKRRDGLFAYQLVVVLDDIRSGINNVVRGADLIDPSVRQIGLFNTLSSPPPQYAHLPLAVTEPGQKLSKQNHAPAVDNANPVPALVAALRFLGQPLPDDATHLSVTSLLEFAIQHWRLEHVPAQKEQIVHF